MDILKVKPSLSEGYFSKNYIEVKNKANKILGYVIYDNALKDEPYYIECNEHITTEIIKLEDIDLKEYLQTKIKEFQKKRKDGNWGLSMSILTKLEVYDEILKLIK